MKRPLFVLAASLALALPAGAVSSTHFSTIPGTAFTWQFSWTGENWLLSFPANSVQIDYSSPADAALLADYVNLPSMVLSNLQDQGTFLTATLTPTGSLTLVRDTDDQTVLTADMASQSALFIGTNYIAYSNIADDLDVTDYVPQYSLIIDDAAAADAAGIPIDISFSGEVAGGVDLVALLRTTGGAGGSSGSSLSGQITIIPVPGTLLLVAVGALAVGSLRRRALR